MTDTTQLIDLDYTQRLAELVMPREVIFAAEQEHDDQINAPCFDCNGDGGWDVITGYSSRDGEPTGWWETCPTCEGRGGGWIDAEPRTIDDLDCY